MTPVLDQSTNIIFIGFASSGKTTTGIALSQCTGLTHIDLDRELESLHQKQTGESLSCREIFRKIGKIAFSGLETEALQNLESAKGVILSTGGQAPMRSENRELLKKFGLVIYLRADLPTTLERMKPKGIPLTLSGEDMEQQWNLRDTVYTEVADIIIDNSKLDPEATAQFIIDNYFRK